MIYMLILFLGDGCGEVVKSQAMHQTPASDRCTSPEQC